MSSIVRLAATDGFSAGADGEAATAGSETENATVAVRPFTLPLDTRYTAEKLPALLGMPLMTSASPSALSAALSPDGSEPETFSTFTSPSAER